MPKFVYHPTETFSSKMVRIRRKDPVGHDRILEVVDRLLESPGDADGWMHGIYAGKLKKYVGRKDYRVIYQWCERCRKEEKRLEVHCGSCGHVTDNSVIFFDVYHKNEQESHLRHIA